MDLKRLVYGRRLAQNISKLKFYAIIEVAKRGVFSTEGMNLGCLHVPEREQGAADHRRVLPLYPN